MIFIPRNRPRTPGRFLHWKMSLLLLGAVLLLPGMALQNNWLVGAGLGVLVVAFLLRFLERDREDAPPERHADWNSVDDDEGAAR